MDDERLRGDAAAGRLCAVVLVVAAGLFAPPPALAAPSSIDELSSEERETLSDLVKRAKETYQSGEFEETIDVLERAYGIFPRASFLYRMGLCYEKREAFDEAVSHYRRFLEESSETDKRGEVEAKIERLEETMRQRSRATVSVQSTPAGATVSVGEAGEASARGTTPIELAVDPGQTRLVVEKEGREQVVRTREFEAQKTYTVGVKLPESSEEESDEEGGADEQTNESARETRTFPTLPVVLTGVGGASLVVSSIFAVQSAKARAELQDVRSDPRRYSRDREKTLVSKRKTFRGVAIGTGVVAVGALGAATYVWLARASGGGRADRATPGGRSVLPVVVSAGPRPGGAGVSIRGRMP